MDLEKRIEDLTKERNELNELLKLQREAERAKSEYERVSKEPARDDNDRKHLALLQHRMEAAQKRSEEQAKKYEELRTKTTKEIHADVNTELSSYVEKDVSDRNPEDFINGTVNPYMAGKSGIEVRNYERMTAITRAQAKKAENEEILKDIDARIDEAIKNGEDSLLEILQARKGKIEVENRRHDIEIANLQKPYKSIEESEAEYSALYTLKKSLEQSIDLKEISPYSELSYISKQLRALDSIATARDEAIPPEDRYNDLKGKKSAISKKKSDAKKTIESLKDKLAKGEIGKEYVDSVRARIKEIEGEVADYEKQEQEYAGKMQKLEEKYNLKPEPTAMEKYEIQVEQYKKLQEMEAKKQAEVDEINEKLKADPDNKDLQEQKEKLDKELAKIKATKPGIEKSIEDSKKLLGIDDDKDKGKGKGDDDDKGKGKGDDDDDKGKGKGDDDDDKGKGKGKGDDDDKGKGDKKPAIVDYHQYYDALKGEDKWQTKMDSYEYYHGHKPGFIMKNLLKVPLLSNLVVSGKTCVYHLEDGGIKPRFDYALKVSTITPKTQKEEPKKEEPKPDPFKADEETIKKTEEAARAAAQKEKDAAILAQMNELLAKCPPDQKENLLKAFAARTGVKPEVPKAKTEPEKGGAEK